MKKFFTIILVLLLLGSLGAAGYFYLNYEKVKKNPNLVSKEEVKVVTENVKKLMELPTDEQPTLATVTDREKLKDQDFFKKSQNGDKILIFSKAKKAILYRPSLNKIIEFAFLVMNDSAEQKNNETPSASSLPPATVAIYNGTKIGGLSSEVEKQITGIDNLSIKDKTFASKNDYSENLVFDISGLHKSEANEIAQKIGGTLITSLPEGESKPSTDILVIAGNSKL